LIQAKAIKTWQKLSRRERKEIRRRSMRASDAVMRCRCKAILGLVPGKAPTMIAQCGLCAKSQVYRVADRFMEYGLVGHADRREDNGENKATDAGPARTLSSFGNLGCMRFGRFVCIPFSVLLHSRWRTENNRWRTVGMSIWMRPFKCPSDLYSMLLRVLALASL